jgi:putative DNA primase/helicase
MIDQVTCTLLFDEAQSLGRKGESYDMKELLCASIGKESRVYRCERKKEDYEPRSFKTYCPKVFALIGPLDGVLADRAIPIEMARKTEQDQVQRYRRRIVEPRGKKLHDELEMWAAESKEYVSAWYSGIDPFGEIENDRMADLLMPLQAVLLAGSTEGIKALEEYARDLDDRDRRQETQSHGVRLLAACREILDGQSFIPTADLVSALKERSEEPWHRWNKGEGMNAEALANLLRPYGIKPQHNKVRTQRGYHTADFADAWNRYLTPLESPSSPSMVSKLL